MDGRARVMVLGWTVADDLFGSTNPVGREVRVSMFGQRGEPFTVIGILEEKGGTGFGNQDDRVIIPITTLQYRLFPDRASNGEFKVSTIYVQAADQESTAAAIEQIKQDPPPASPRHPGRFHNLESAGNSRNLERGNCCSNSLPWRNRRYFAAGGRYRNHEYHVGLGYRADSRNRNTQSAWSQAPRYSRSVPRRIRHS